MKAKIRKVIVDPDNEIFFSQISLIEITIKQTIGKLPNVAYPVKTLARQLIKDGFTLLPVSNEHIFSYNLIPLREDHRDPFDRLLIATAYSENLSIISADEKFLNYSSLVKIIQ